jgi:hypothetical protein
LKIDLHVHSRLSKAFDYNHDDITKLRDLGRRRGLDGFALTEHIHALNFWEMHEHLRSTYRYRDGYYDLGDGFRMFSGCEVTVGERVDFIVVGEYDELEKLDASFCPRLSESNLVPGIDFLTRARELELLVISAHPFRPGKEIAKLPLGRVFSLVDGVEANGRDHGTETRVCSLARQFSLPVSGGSDAHYFLQIGVRSTVIPSGELTLDSLRGAFARRRTRAHCKTYTPRIVEFCQAFKRMTKLRLEGEVGMAVVA